MTLASAGHPSIQYPIVNALRHRPPRLSRLFQGNRSFYFVTFNTWKRRPILAHPTVHARFQGFAENAKSRGIHVGRYVILPDHVHLFVALPEEGIPLARWMQSLRSVLGKTLLTMRHPKPHWQEGFFDHLLRGSESYAEKWEYVRMNPVRAGLAERPEDWPFQGEIESIRY